MTTKNRWIRRDSDKVPRQVDGRPASSTNPTTWCSFHDATTSTAGVGLGFVLGDGVGCIDLDHCLDADGNPNEQARRILSMAPATFIEVSPSGDGLHIWGKLPQAPGRRANGVEVYSTGRYITVTNRPWRTSSPVLADLRELVAAI
jgi:primase-polymerase (primpol)-like protein